MTQSDSSTSGYGRDGEEVGEGRPVSLPQQRHLARVAAEEPRVSLDPVESGDLVEQGVVALGVAVLRAQEPCTNQVRSGQRLGQVM